MGKIQLDVSWPGWSERREQLTLDARGESGGTSSNSVVDSVIGLGVSLTHIRTSDGFGEVVTRRDGMK
jgi:hypothetical protein